MPKIISAPSEPFVVSCVIFKTGVSVSKLRHELAYIQNSADTIYIEDKLGYAVFTHLFIHLFLEQTKKATMYWLPNVHKNLIKLDLLPTLARVLLLNFLNY